MSTRTIVYGNVFDPEKRQELDSDQTDKPVEIFFRGEPTLNGIEGPLTVFIDLDDPTFNNPDFLVSLATAGEKVKLIGKAAEPDLDQSIRVLRPAPVRCPSRWFEGPPATVRDRLPKRAWP